MDTPAALAFLSDQIPVKHQVLLPPVFRSAYNAVNALANDTPFLKVPSAIFNRGRMVTWAVDYAIENLIQSGRWNVDYRWATFGSPKVTGKYIEIILPQSRMMISQISDPTRQPRNVGFRENARVFNSPFLFKEMDEDRITGRPSFLLVHGHQELSFLHIGIPHATRRYGYICTSTNLLNLPHEVVAPGPPAEDTSFNDTMTLKDQIERWLKDHGG
ncbi:MAG TPA: hypothetical protein VI485_03870 [Vicinamibacterales bacterium]|nr:hypothetical protein [Vicinamibacterales bacterium]